jgi:hypothetical protein
VEGWTGIKAGCGTGAARSVPRQRRPGCVTKGSSENVTRGQRSRRVGRLDGSTADFSEGMTLVLVFFPAQAANRNTRRGGFEDGDPAHSAGWGARKEGPGGSD